VHRAHQPEFGIFEIKAMPRFEQVMHTFTLDQRA
jgi:hypothetical protein